MLPPPSTRKQAFAAKGVRPVSSSTSSTTRGLETRAGLKRDFSDIVPSTFPTTATTSASLSRTSSSETTSSSWDFDLNPGQITAGIRNCPGMNTNPSTYDDLSPIIPSLSPPPLDDQRHSPLLSPVSTQPPRRSAKIMNVNGKHLQQRPQVLFDNLEEDLDTDPIVDFDSDEDSNNTIVMDQILDEPILNSLAPASASALTTALAPSRGRRKKVQNPRGRGALLQQPPQQPQHLVSPGRQKFHLPVLSPVKQGTDPPSPAKHLRPVSELARILLAPSPVLSSAVVSPTTSIPVPPTEAKSAGTSTTDIRRTTNFKGIGTYNTMTAVTSAPKLKLTDIARSLKLPTPAQGLQKPSPPAFKPHRITSDVKEEQIAQAKARYNKPDHRTDSNIPGKRKAIDSLNEYHEPSHFNCVKQEQEPEKKGSGSDEARTQLPKSLTPGNASTQYDDTSPIIPLTNYKSPLMNDDSIPIAQSEEVSICQEKQQQDQEQQRQEKERKKKELLLEVYAMRRTLKSSLSSAASLLPPILPPPAPPPGTSTSSSSTGGHISANLVQNSEEDRIPIPDDVLEYAPKLTLIDQIKWAPVKEGRYHILALIMAIEPMEVIAAKFSTGNNNYGASNGFQKVLVSVCDQSATSFKVVLWREKANWIYLLKPGDAVLFTDLQMKEFRNKISGNSSSWSKMSRMDGSVMARYKGSKNNQDDPASATIESILHVFLEKRRVLALDLLDPDKGIARAPSCYLSPSMSLFSPPQHLQEQGQQQIWPGTTTSTRTTAMNSAITTAIPRLLRPIAPPLAITSNVRPSSIKSNIPPTVVSGASIRASVVYRMLIVPNEDNAGWEIGSVMSNGRFVKVQSTSNAPTWINKIVPGKLMNFFGIFTKTSDGSVVFSLDGARDPASLSENAWGNSIKQIELKRFRTIRALREHQFMGDAIIEDTTILAVRFPNLTSDYNVDDNNKDAMFSFIQCYCKGCSSPTVASPQNPSILFCPHCHLDPQRRQTSTLEWYYPPFEVTLTDRTSRLGASLSVEMIQVRCQMELGNQIFADLPADQWMTSGDEAQFWKCRDQWVKIMKHLNNANSLSDENHIEGDQTSKNKAQDQSGPHETGKKRVKVEVRVGLNFVAKGLSIHYL